MDYSNEPRYLMKLFLTLIVRLGRLFVLYTGLLSNVYTFTVIILQILYTLLFETVETSLNTCARQRW